jgi:hypothetical protein
MGGRVSIGNSLYRRPQTGRLGRQGAGKQLYGTLLFEAELTVARRLGSQTRVGITFAHVSNGYRHGSDVRLNPGAEMLLVTVLLPLGL